MKQFEVEKVEDRSRIFLSRVFFCLGLLFVGYFVGAARFYDACIGDKYSPATCLKATKQIYGWSVLR